MAKTTTGTLSSVVKAYYDKRFLMRAEANFVYKQLGRIGVVPAGEGKTIVWNRYTNPSAKTSALTEGRQWIIALLKSLLNNWKTFSSMVQCTLHYGKDNQREDFIATRTWVPSWFFRCRWLY